ncbi:MULTISPECIES: carboxy-S-adenosyl-L-methionine synthase CmoA [unclassified Oceanobacter]|jgi:tRNA (cmo5U34)-methyltransferase|uniref:carboxy-S-adenosyl-L-methionine synthase CmoA n=1 Tax=unclassified Oceanobacter TaxID=2620260 RepID=UPI0026E36324|nr:MULTISPECIES: carboxy-S-adenosyl-L-methionine synthase CmoA [unclassified Oceanobacter]MDO6681764.1 carboxy-S-adenosyl-L-methionine synthase CmoA [Oceanobacter sp. 5_MG-2023]MDP2506225.1 carboxy-S-adenosyl-L-methionine synthase CmoA [Oceanobacter sp. 3_MG-2023]MDP2546513.1 carboxy-S-adenosyl-L-methionine synthase CmoA [Oceanobacter sp. 4_MG-2023]MDP2609699.1 carboxy-S-adenosyl-L-methionine synthase CmoA [Oceanobacter sp. 1_MG-2023]MDP2613852.1 carboxy-S-adenosyl-L-methionine synthase CmoA [
MNERDDLYQTRESRSADFRFDDAVARIFPDMIKRSVPGYAETVAMSGIIAGRYAQDNTHLYDLGCSLGAVTLAMRHGVRAQGCQIIGVDNSAAMLERAAHYIALDDHSLAGDSAAVELLQADICSLALETTSVTALNYVLQFIALDQRLDLLTRIAEATVPGGALILSEKICFDEAEQPVQDALHWDFKRANGYSEMEIARKRTAIENYLIPEREEVHRQRLLAAGFRQVTRWYQCFNFVSFLAVR